ncbi:MAG TPA: L,D-transpeptidase [Gammaproteobacteria bacterium]|nr:L,D-transpeptidase [Gammaproteobacteria bacterium]
MLRVVGPCQESDLVMVERIVKVDLRGQLLELHENGRVVRRYPVSTSRFGAGEQSGSNKTPRGRHVIRAKIGANQPRGAVFVGRRPTGEIYSEALACAEPARDWILTRILWLSGTERGKNRLGDVDTMRRYIYIHGAPDSSELGVPGSIGCVRMSNDAVIELFDLVSIGDRVEIVE